jgi:hypothetical protein
MLPTFYVSQLVSYNDWREYTPPTTNHIYRLSQVSIVQILRCQTIKRVIEYLVLWENNEKH